MAGKFDAAGAASGAVRVAKGVNACGRHFGHLGFKPIRGVH